DVLRADVQPLAVEPHAITIAVDLPIGIIHALTICVVAAPATGIARQATEPVAMRRLRIAAVVAPERRPGQSEYESDDQRHREQPHHSPFLLLSIERLNRVSASSRRRP